MRTKLHTLLVGTSCALLPLAAFADISFLSGVSLPNGGEITSYATDGSVLVTDSIGGGSANHAAQSYTLTSGGTLTAGAAISLNSVFGTAADINSVSSVLNDVRGFGVATIIPTVNTEGSLGRIAIFDKSNGSILKTLDVGYHPDSVSMTPDGTKLLIVNEGEFISTSADATFARPGSVSVIDISGVTAGNYTTALAGLTSGAVSTYDFTAGNLGSGVTIDGLRNARLDTLTTKTANAGDIEPEYITATNTTAYVTLQENNAIAALDLATGKYTAIHDLGSITKTIDASDRDGASSGTSISINDVVRGLPMPDTLTKFEREGSTFLVTANEGDARPDDGDIARGAASAIDIVDNGSGDQIYTGGNVGNTGIGRLSILKDQGDTDGDGLIENPTMMGTRSFSIWNAETGALVFDSASMIEEFVAANDPTTFNINSGNLAANDTRSDDKGPEVEALAFGSIDGKDFVFVGAERQNGIFQFDITDLENVFIAGYYNPISGTDDSGGAFISPESIVFIGAGDNPTGQNLLLVGFEGTGGNGSLGVFAVTSAIPEPSAFAALAGLGALGLSVMRRRRA